MDPVVGTQTSEPDMLDIIRAHAFDLNVERVLEHWTPAHAVREVIANALDEAALTGTAEPTISRDEVGRWHVRDFGRGLRYEHLTQNEDREKLAHPELVIGKFGIGLKDALAVFDRRRVTVVLRSRQSDMTIAPLPKHGFEDLVTLHVIVSPPSEPGMAGTEVILEGLKDTDVDEAKALFLRYAGDEILEETANGAVIARTKGKPARIYVNGLLVATEDEFLFSYNVTSMSAALRRALNRERQNVGRTAYTDRVKAILLAATSKAVADALARDLAKYEAGTNHDETSWTDVALHACRILNANEKVLFATSMQLMYARALIDQARRDGYRVVTVPENLANRLPKAVDLAGAPIVDLGVFREHYLDSFQYRFVEEPDLTPAERSLFARTNEIIRLQGRRPEVLKNVRISETMRINDEGTGATVGSWDADTRSIVIRRDQLKKVSTYAGTLLHELTHARTATDDVSREFEEALTRTLGTVADQALAGNPEHRSRQSREKRPKPRQRNVGMK